MRSVHCVPVVDQYLPPNSTSVDHMTVRKTKVCLHPRLLTLTEHDQVPDHFRSRAEVFAAALSGGHISADEDLWDTVASDLLTKAGPHTLR